jgi:hypothetical protein
VDWGRTELVNLAARAATNQSATHQLRIGVKNVSVLPNERSPSVTVHPDDIPVKLTGEGLTFMDASCSPMMALIA